MPTPPPCPTSELPGHTILPSTSISSCDQNSHPGPLLPVCFSTSDGLTLAQKFGADSEGAAGQMVSPESLWGIHVDSFPNFYMMIGPQSLNPVRRLRTVSLHNIAAQYIHIIYLHNLLAIGARGQD